MVVCAFKAKDYEPVPDMEEVVVDVVGLLQYQLVFILTKVFVEGNSLVYHRYEFEKAWFQMGCEVRGN